MMDVELVDVLTMLVYVKWVSRVVLAEMDRMRAVREQIGLEHI